MPCHVSAAQRYLHIFVNCCTAHSSQEIEPILVSIIRCLGLYAAVKKIVGVASARKCIEMGIETGISILQETSQAQKDRHHIFFSA